MSKKLVGALALGSTMAYSTFASGTEFCNVEGGILGDTICVNGDQQRFRHVTRQTSDAIARQLSSRVIASFRNTFFAASADSAASGASPWSLLSYSQLSNDKATHVDQDFYMVLGGIDAQFGHWIAGTTLAYNYTNEETTGANGDAHTVALNPYAAYVFSENVFVHGVLGYNHTEVIGHSTRVDSDEDNFTVELDLNAVKVVDNWILKGRLGSRYLYFGGDYDNVSGIDDNQNTLSWIADTEVGYAISDNWTTYAGLQYEYSHFEEEKNDGTLFVRVGSDYSLTDTLSLGLKLQTKANSNSENVDNSTIELNMSLAL